MFCDMRAAIAFLALLAASIAAAAPASTSPTELRITAWPNGPSGAAKRWTLQCEPAGGTLPRAGQACASLARMTAPLRPTPPGSVCTQIYGGPATAIVTGVFEDRRIWTRFSRRDGCEINRWNRHRFLFPVTLGSPE